MNLIGLLIILLIIGALCGWHGTGRGWHYAEWSPLGLAILFILLLLLTGTLRI